MRFGLGKRRFQPRHVCFIARQILCVAGITLLSIASALLHAILGAQHQIIVAARHVEANEGDRAILEAGVLHISVAQLALVFHCQSTLTQSIQGGEHGFAQMGESLQRIKTTVVDPVAIGPFVVAGHIHHRFCHAVEHFQSIGVNVIGAFGAAVFDVAVVQRESDVRCVDAVQHRRQLGVIACFFVGHVTPQAKGVGGVSSERCRRSAGGGVGGARDQAESH